MPRTTRARMLSGLLAAGVATAALAACGSTTGPAGANADATATSADQNPSAFLPPTGAASAVPATAAAAPSAGPTAASTAANTPAVTGATDLTKEPVLAAGTGTGPTGLVTKDLVLGTGAVAVATDTVDVKYVGTVYPTGKVFDASWGKTAAQTGDAQDTANFPLAEVVPGFSEGIVGMKVGGRREIVIPAALGYGPEGGQPAAGISATDTIVFVVDLVKVSTP